MLSRKKPTRAATVAAGPCFLAWPARKVESSLRARCPTQNGGAWQGLFCFFRGNDQCRSAAQSEPDVHALIELERARHRGDAVDSRGRTGCPPRDHGQAQASRGPGPASGPHGALRARHHRVAGAQPRAPHSVGSANGTPARSASNNASPTGCPAARRRLLHRAGRHSAHLTLTAAIAPFVFRKRS